jgi:hypothetical protein
MTEPEGPGDPQSQGERDDRPELDIDSAFDAIIKGFEDPVPHGVGPWPASEDLDDEADDSTDGADDASAAPVDAERPPADRWDPPLRRITLPADRDEPAAAARDVVDEDDDEEGYEPPEPPPFPRGDLVSRVAWAAVVGGPVFLLVAALAWRSLPTFLLLIALTAFVGGFVTLVARMPQDHPDDPDDGAVV